MIELPTQRVKDLPTLPHPTPYIHRWSRIIAVLIMFVLSWMGYSFPLVPLAATGQYATDVQSHTTWHTVAASLSHPPH